MAAQYPQYQMPPEYVARRALDHANECIAAARDALELAKLYKEKLDAVLEK